MISRRVIVIGVLLAFSLILLASIGIASARTIYVPDNYAKIQWAVNNASAGDTIIARDGVYTENIKVNKRLTIKSENGSDKTIVQAANPDDHVFEVTSDYVNISGFEMDDAGGYLCVGIYLYYVNYSNISNNCCPSNCHGICLSYSDNNTIMNNNVYLNDYDGINLFYSDNNTITGNDADINHKHGIYFFGSDNNIVTGNDASNNYEEGILLFFGSDNNNITGNNAYINDEAGIELNWYSNNNIITGNDASNNHDGITLSWSSNNIITGNNASNNGWHGIYLGASSNNIITGNDASNNDHDGIYPFDSSDNKIYLNNFINNTDNVYSYDSTNIWNSTEKITYTYKGKTYENYMGNYWDDYLGGDTDKDGIGDTPYSIDSDEDCYPLMLPWENYFAPMPSVEISTDKHDYTAGDTMLINITLANPTEEWQNVKFLWRLDFPDYGLRYPIINNKSLRLPSGFDKSFILPWKLPSWGFSFNASWYVALYDATTSELICEDTADWRYVSGAITEEEIVPEEIAKEIKGLEEIAEGIELPG